ncbi:SufB/SufD family protein [Albidovulum sediminis]|uniref:SufD family Fe-S cluster assembly protein n=1 Tax=Albidovulum sediminis TaxID=3066345 RepID=A0ABT2NJI0_9RHOB|nr:SufD family Fe-S cluster assembly protein [Defluviimonas sediminis]MCT8328906.1 SufD family Fe-S cluster assembly protein [Defluviimonas sediminis]
MAAAMTKDARRADATEARLAALALPKGGFTAPARADALARLRATGLPVRRDEYWRWTDPARLNADRPDEGAAFRVDRPIFEGRDKVRLVFEDGVFDAAASDDPALAGVEIARLSEADRADIHWAKAHYGALEAAGQSPVLRPFAALNTAAATEGLLIRVTGKAPRPLHISYRQSEKTSDVILHHVVRVEEGAALTLLETGTPGARANVVTEVDVAKDGQFHHIRPQGRAIDRVMVTHLFARVAEGATFKSFTLTTNGRFTRNEAVIHIAGDGATAHIAGAALGDGEDGPFHHDDTVFVTHDAVGCESRQVFKKVLKHGATGVFQGKILVRPGAQKTDGYQISQSLLLDDDSQFLAKPELEIYADDVKCSHGSTTGAIDETALFYLRSRGVAEEDAKALLILSFLADAIAEIEDAEIAADVVERLEDWLQRRRK